MRRKMSNVGSIDDAVSQLIAQGDAVGRLAQNEGGFAAAVAAFEAKDANAFRWVLQRLDQYPQCELICEWLRTKLCVLRCLEVCGVPRENTPTPGLGEFARAVVQLTSNEKLLRRVVDAIACPNADDFQEALAELKLGDFCHLLCHWICSITYRRVCEVVCTPQPVPVLDPVNEIRDAGRVIATLLAKEQAFETVSAAAARLNCETLRTVIGEAGLAQEPGCEIICRWICSWRCVLVCRELCAL